MSKWTEGPFTLTASEAIEKFKIVKLVDGTETQVALAGVGDEPLGWTKDTVASGALITVYPFNTAGSFTAEAASAIPAGALVYGAASGEVDDAAGGRLLGRYMSDSAAADGDEIEVLPILSGTAVLQSSVAETIEVENTTTETAFADTAVIPANSLKAGDFIKVYTAIVINDSNSTDTFQYKVRVGGTAMATSAAVDAADADTGNCFMLIKVRTTGATGTMVTYGWQSDTDAVGQAMENFYTAIGSIDTTAAITIDVTGTWSVAHADNEAAMIDLTVEKS